MTKHEVPVDKQWVSVPANSLPGTMAQAMFEIHDAAASVVIAKEGELPVEDWPIRALKDATNEVGALLGEDRIGLSDNSTSPDEDHYLLCIWGDIEPELLGPFKTAEARDGRARQLRQESGADHGLFPLSTTKGTPTPRIDCYSGGFYWETP